MRNKFLLFFGPLAFLTFLLFTNISRAADVPVMTKDELNAMLQNTGIVIFDVRLGSNYFSSDLKIKGAVRPDMGENICGTTSKYPKGTTFVFFYHTHQDKL